MTPHVTIYTDPNCATCRLVKAYFDERGLSYEERDVTSDPGARQELHRIGARGVPVTVIDQEAVLGLDTYRFDDLLKAKGARPG